MSSDSRTTSDRGPEANSSTSIMWLLGTMVLIPVRMFIHGMEILVTTMRGMQEATDRGLVIIAGGDPANSDAQDIPVIPSGAGATQFTNFGTEFIGSGFPETSGVRNVETIGKESPKMPDTNLSDDLLKLIRYKILFIKRDYEYAFPEKEELVFDNMTDSAFTAWKVAEFIQSLDTIEVPEKWLKKVPPYPSGRKIINGKEVIHTLDETDKKFLRVYFEVLQRYAREKLAYEEDQLDALRGIITAIEKHGAPFRQDSAGAEAAKRK